MFTVPEPFTKSFYDDPTDALLCSAMADYFDEKADDETASYLRNLLVLSQAQDQLDKKPDDQYARAVAAGHLWDGGHQDLARAYWWQVKHSKYPTWHKSGYPDHLVAVWNWWEPGFVELNPIRNSRGLQITLETCLDADLYKKLGPDHHGNNRADVEKGLMRALKKLKRLPKFPRKE